MLAKFLIFLGIVLVLIGLGLGIWAKTSTETIFVAEKFGPALGVVGVIIVATGIVISVVNGFFNAAESAAKYMGTDEGKKALLRTTRQLKRMERKSKDPLGIRKD